MASWIPLFDPNADDNAFDRMLLALATHPAGAGFEHAVLLVWSSRSERFEGWLAWHAPRVPTPLGEWLEAAARPATTATDVERLRAQRERVFALAELPETARRAWGRGGSATGPVADDAGPWRAGVMLGGVALTGERRYALLVGEWPGPESADETRLETLRRIGDQALRLRARVQTGERLTRQLATARALAHATGGSGNLAELAQTLAEATMEMTGARGALLWRRGEGDQPTLTGAAGPVGTRERAARALAPLARAVLDEGRARRHGDDRPDPRLPADLTPAIGVARVVPCSADGRVSGVLAIYGRDVRHPSESADFGAEALSALGMMADQAARLFERAAADDQRRGLERHARELLIRAERAERSARAGEMAARAALEARNPAAAIAAFARRIQRGLTADDVNREYLEVVLRETERLEQTLLDPGPLPDADPSALALVDLNTLVGDVLQRHAETLVRRRVRLLKRLTPVLPALLLDAERVRRVLQNLLQHALDAVSAGGRLRVETRRAQGHVIVELAHDGPRPSGELLDELFVPFQIARPAGGPVAIAIARQIVQEHGGEIRVRSEGEWGAIFTLTLPVRGNEDRRLPGGDRRRARSDRRARV
ncbi:MAG TPA: ATP-binding protein [Dongiaceae bacterium]|nr:ATP-binding protein [Dongiaceae bacterium]